MVVPKLDTMKVAANNVSGSTKTTPRLQKGGPYAYPETNEGSKPQI